MPYFAFFYVGRIHLRFIDTNANVDVVVTELISSKRWLFACHRGVCRLSWWPERYRGKRAGRIKQGNI